MKNNRASHQTARKGWKPKQTSDKQLALDIVASIKAHTEYDGVIKRAEDYTQREEVIALVDWYCDTLGISWGMYYEGRKAN